MNEAITVANKTAAERVAEAGAALVQASYVGLAVGALVILVLIASAAFGMLSIARPIASGAGCDWRVTRWREHAVRARTDPDF